MTSNPSENQAHRSVRDVDRELDDLAHMLRSPLTALRGGLDMLNGSGREGLNDIGQRGLDVALSATRRLTALIDDTLLMARHRADRLELSLSVESTAEVVRRTLRRYPELAESLDYQFETGVEEVEVVTDLELATMAIGRLAGLMSDPEKKVSLRVSAGDRSGVFELAGAAAFSAERGTGAASGIEACGLVAELHHGTFAVGPTEAGGTIARFTLPTAD